MSETNNPEMMEDMELALGDGYQLVEDKDVMSLIKEQTSGITIKSDDIKNLTKILKEWNDCYLSKKEPKKELEEIKIDNFTLSYEEFKNLLDNGLLSNQYYSDKDTMNLDMQEANLDMMMPSMSKDGIFNMMAYNLAKHSSVSDEVELHYASAGDINFSSHSTSLKYLYDVVIKDIIKESMTDGKVHFILTDEAGREHKVKSGHVTSYIVVNGEIFGFDSVSRFEINEEYATKYLQQTDQTSCRSIAIREMDDFLKILENFYSAEEFSSYLKQFFSENKIEYYIDPDNPNGDLIEGSKEEEDEKKSKRNERLAILPFPILKNSQPLSSLKKTFEVIQNLEKKQKGLSGKEKEKFIKKYKHILEMKDKLEKLINRFEIQKKISKNKTVSVSAYTLKERLRQAKVLAILLEKGRAKSLEYNDNYNRGRRWEPSAVTVGKKWIKEINNKTEDNIKNREIRILENNKLKEEREKTKSTITYKIFNFFSKIFLGRETNYKTKQEKLLKEEMLINRIFREHFRTVSALTGEQISNQNKLIQQNIQNEFDNTIDIRVRNK